MDVCQLGRKPMCTMRLRKGKKGGRSLRLRYIRLRFLCLKIGRGMCKGSFGLEGATVPRIRGKWLKCGRRSSLEI